MGRLLILILLLVVQASAHDSIVGQRNSLRGVGDSGGVCVFVTIKMAGDYEISITEATLRTETELSLRLAGITVVDSLYDSGLSIDILIYRPKFKNTPGLSSGYTSSISVGLIESLYNIRGKLVSGYTWTTTKLIVSPTEKVTWHIKETLKELTGRFLNDYLAANQKNDKEKKPSIYDVIDKDDG